MRAVQELQFLSLAKLLCLCSILAYSKAFQLPTTSVSSIRLTIAQKTNRVKGIPKQQQSSPSLKFTPLAACSMVATGWFPSPGKWYRVSSILMAITSILLLASIPFVDPTAKLSMVQQRQTSLATQWASAASFGIASYIFHWLPQRIPQSLNKQLHIGLLSFCALGLMAIPGEFGMRMITTNVLAPPTELWISIVGLLLATLARVTGFWTALKGLQSIFVPHQEANDTHIEGEEYKTTIMVPTSLHISNGKSWLQRLWVVPKSHRKQTLFYRNVMLLLMATAGSNLMEGLFRWRYRSALSTPFSALDISMSISAGSRLLFFSALTYTLKSGSETLPPIQELYDRPSRIQSISGKDAKVEQLWKKPNYMDIHDCKYPVLDLLQQHLAKSLAKLNFLLATWPLLVCLGRSVMMRPVSLAKPEMLLLSALFAIKGYRLWSWPHRMIEIPPNEESNNKGET